MSFETALVLAVLAVAMALFATGRFPPDLIALGVLVVVALAGVLDAGQAIGGFANPAVVTIGAVYVMSSGLARTGVAYEIGRLIRRVSGGSERRLVAIVMLVAAGLSGFMNAIAAAAVLLPAVVAAAREMNTPISRVLIPLSYATLMGSLLTLVGTPANLLVHSLLIDEGYTGFSLFEFTPFGLVALVAGVTVMTLGGRRLLPARATGAGIAAMLPAGRREHPQYRLEDRLFELYVPPASDLTGRTLSDTAMGESFGVWVVAISRRGRTIVSLTPSTAVIGGDVLIVSARPEDLDAAAAAHSLEVRSEMENGTSALQTESVEIVEAALTPRSGLHGQTLNQIGFRDRYGLNVLGIWRDGVPRRTHLRNLPLEQGDALLVHGPHARIEGLRRSPDFVVLTEQSSRPLRRGRAPVAVAILLGFVVALLAGWASVPIVAVTAAVAMVATGCVGITEARSSVEWRAVVLIGAMLALAEAMRETGAASLAASGLASNLDVFGPWLVVAGVMLLTFVFTHVLGNHVTAVLMTPVAIDAAIRMDADPRMFALSVALAAATGFVSPYSHPGNILVMGPGNYRFGDYVKAGSVVAVLILAALFGMLVLVFGVMG